MGRRGEDAQRDRVHADADQGAPGVGDPADLGPLGLDDPQVGRVLDVDDGRLVGDQPLELGQIDLARVPDRWRASVTVGTIDEA